MKNTEKRGNKQKVVNFYPISPQVRKKKKKKRKKCNLTLRRSSEKKYHSKSLATRTNKECYKK